LVARRAGPLLPPREVPEGAHHQVGHAVAEVDETVLAGARRPSILAREEPPGHLGGGERRRRIGRRGRRADDARQLLERVGGLAGDGRGRVDGDRAWGHTCGRSRSRRSSIVSARRPSRSVSSGITSAGAMLPRLTSAPKCLMNQACCSFCGASKSSLLIGTSCTISSIRPERTSPVWRKIPLVPDSRASVITLKAPASSSSLIQATHWYGA